MRQQMQYRREDKTGVFVSVNETVSSEDPRHAFGLEVPAGFLGQAEWILVGDHARRARIVMYRHPTTRLFYGLGGIENHGSLSHRVG